MADLSASGLSAEEFQRMQNSLLELRTSNYQLAEQISKKDKEIANLHSDVRKLEDELRKASRSKRAKANDVLDTSEPDALRQKLATQEEEFRLQQSMLIGELQKVIGQQEELEQQVRDLKESGGNKEALRDLEAENAKLKKEIEELRANNRQCLEDGSKEEPVNSEENGSSKEKQLDALQTLEAELTDTKKILSTVEQEKKALMEKLNTQTEEAQTKSAIFQKELVELKEQLRRKQASYVSLTEEKERQLEEFKKSLDNMVQKKDSEIKALVDDLNSLRRQMQMTKDNERLAAGEKASLESALKEAELEVRQIREQNEGFQIQLQETISASDCLSSQLQETRKEVEQMQRKLEEATEVAAKRKSLLDEMSQHLENVQDEFGKRARETALVHEQEIDKLKKQLGEAQELNEETRSLKQKLLLMENLLQTGEDRCSILEKQLEELTSTISSREATLKETADNQKMELERQVDELRVEMETEKSGCEQKLASLIAERDEQARLVQELKQEVKDKEDSLKAVERKHQSVIKDLKRQLQNEKKRNDRLQEKVQDGTDKATTESARNKSPGNTSYEEIRPTELAENRPRTVGDAASVSSWTVVSEKQHKDSDRHSTHTDRDSESSITMLESDNHELISRVTELQKKNFELRERVTLLEDSSAAMAEDLMNKATLIEQFLKEKSGLHMGPPSPEKLPPGLKKVIDLMKIDQSAVEIRDMNKRLQLMLEETLTKNMHLQKDLEIMSQEVARLSTTLS